MSLNFPKVPSFEFASLKEGAEKMCLWSLAGGVGAINAMKTCVISLTSTEDFGRIPLFTVFEIATKVSRIFGERLLESSPLYAVAQFFLAVQPVLSFSVKVLKPATFVKKLSESIENAHLALFDGKVFETVMGTNQDGGCLQTRGLGRGITKLSNIFAKAFSVATFQEKLMKTSDMVLKIMEWSEAVGLSVVLLAEREFLKIDPRLLSTISCVARVCGCYRYIAASLAVLDLGHSLYTYYNGREFSSDLDDVEEKRVQWARIERKALVVGLIAVKVLPALLFPQITLLAEVVIDSVGLLLEVSIGRASKATIRKIDFAFVVEDDKEEAQVAG